MTIYARQRSGAGYDQVDPEACSKHNIQVAHCPNAVDDATADTAVFLMLGALRNFNISMANLRQNKWRGDPKLDLGHDPQGRVLGILGMGGIGRNLKKKAEVFGMTTIYHNRFASYLLSLLTSANGRLQIRVEL